MSPILKRVADTIKLPAHKRFVAEKHFVHDQGFYLWEDFGKNFLDEVEENVPATTLAVYQLQKNALDAQIRKELGQDHEVFLAHFFDLLQKQSKGEEGILLTNGAANIAYIRGKKGVLWAVSALWGSDGRCWVVGAISVENSSDWGGGRQVVSRDC
jgi:hypothetical protein